MRSRAKCRLCKSIIESKHVHDFVSCACGEISVDGGSDYFHATIQTDPKNLIAVDDEGNEIVPKYLRDAEKDPFLSFAQSTDGIHTVESSATFEGDDTREINTASRREILAMIDAMAQRINSMPQEARHSPISHSDFGALLSLLVELLRAS